ncbi:MAG TPA: GlsB/YeaQ/YmgE family stress response membrane protein [Candidatus Nitrosopolaris sp.]|nr:GlsB/YeaQ/YmgE family stress response membrane protein [Candidatus Nitrosopolaris sp.]
MVLNLDFDTILVWVLVGLVAGFFASHLALGHGLGIVGDVIAGVAGALVGGFLAGVFHWSITIVGHPILSAMLIAFIGAVIVLMVLRLFNASGTRRHASWS